MKTKCIIRLLIVPLLLLGYSTMAQSLSRQTLCSIGSSDFINEVLVSQTIGQPYHTGASYSNGISYRPGFQQPTGVSQIKTAERINFLLYPNPVVNFLTVQSSEEIPNAVISVTDMTGVTVYTTNISKLKIFSIDCQQWASGTYVISVSSGKSTIYSAKVIVNTN